MGRTRVVGQASRLSLFRLLGVAAAVSAALPAAAADWSSLDRHQNTITRHEFDDLLALVYCPSGALTNYLTFTTNSVTVFSTPEKNTAPLFTLQFTNAMIRNPQSPIRHARVCLDPGHIGGEWARMEERFFVRGKDRPVQEAVLNLTVARLLKPKLEKAGFTVSLTKDNLEPVTSKRPENFRAEAEREVGRLTRFDSFPPLEREAARANAIRKRQELLFYRSAEIADRARRINEEIKPDLTISIHFNAVEWDECQSLVDDNRLVVFVHGNYLPSEVADDDLKLRLFQKLLERSHRTELTAAGHIANALAKATGLPPVRYAPGGSAVYVAMNPYVYARNLAANRLVNGPVVYLEPYYMNNRVVYQRIQLGDYEGEKEIEGRRYKSIFCEYADGVAEGVIAFSADWSSRQD